MAVTIQQIAEQAGVSRGTVDRALNHRGRINPEVAERICRLADEMGYVQKERKHSRTAKDERLKIGVVTQLARSSFMQEVNRGIEKAAVELKEKGIQLILKEGLSVDEPERPGKRQQQPRSRDELLDYTYCVACCVGLTSARIMGAGEASYP